MKYMLQKELSLPAMPHLHSHLFGWLYLCDKCSVKEKKKDTDRYLFLFLITSQVLESLISKFGNREHWKCMHSQEKLVLI